MIITYFKQLSFIFLFVVLWQNLFAVDQLDEKRPKLFFSYINQLTNHEMPEYREKRLKKYYVDESKRIYGAALDSKHENFNKYKQELIKDWETYAKQEWPKYTHQPKKGNRKPGDLYDAHHIIPQSYNGPNEWWNLFPLTQLQHHDFHSNGTYCSQLFPGR